MKDDIKDRVIAVMHYFDCNNAQFSQKVGLNNNTTIGRIIKGDTRPSFDVLYKILSTFPDLDANWLILGRGKMFLHAENKTEVNEPIPAYGSNDGNEIEIQEIKLDILKLKRQVNIINKFVEANELLDHLKSIKESASKPNVGK
ncbi:helix-turn-helix domain-containing protein [Sunxiuqinia indica]|uniref:helix-turn-helix domain-containing protein n=1 Tax=Sunxiuqinia indica TaxID=2692584 RepID=UPI0013584AEC|nr:helix-turn-helix transcriptional regulator [Sunxiuqinia indica]